MVFTKRERMVGIIAMVGAGLFLLDYLAIEPFVERYNKAVTDIRDLKEKTNLANSSLRRQPVVKSDWDALINSTLKSTPSETESQLLEVLNQNVGGGSGGRSSRFGGGGGFGGRGGQGAGAQLIAFKQERAVMEKEKRFQEVVFQITENGGSSAIADLLWQLETAPVPMRINSIQIMPAKEGTDPVTINLSISSLCLAPSQSETRPAGRQ